MHDPSEYPDGEVPEAGAHDDDDDLFRRVAEAGFTGPLLDLFTAALVIRCRPILHGWLRSGRIFTECAGEGRPLEGGAGGQLDARGRPHLVRSDAV